MLISYKNNTISIIYLYYLTAKCFGNITTSLFPNRFWLTRFYKTWPIAMVPAHTGLHSLIPYFYSEERVWSSNKLGGTPLASACHPSVIHIFIEYSYPYSKNAFQYELNLALLRLSCTKTRCHNNEYNTVDA